MTLDYFTFYSEANIVCILILAVMLVNDWLHSAQQEKQIWLNRTLTAHILYFISDIGWAAVISGHLPQNRVSSCLFNLANFILLGTLAYLWFMYMAASEDLPFRTSRKKRLLCLLPLVVTTLAMIIAYAAAPQFWISDTGELNKLYYAMMIAAPVTYLLSAFVISMSKARKAESADDRRLFLLIGIYPLSVIVFGLVQTSVVNAPLFCFGCTLMMLVFYIVQMQTLVSVDSLTRLNNRGQITRYMNQIHYRDNVPTYVMMVDVDGFKQINDTYGHAEGDRALILVSEVLKQACDHFETPAFLGRYGGDEFTIIFQNPGESDHPARAAEVIRAALSKVQPERGLPYPLEISIGYDMLKSRADTMEACMSRADEKLYEDKRNRKAGR